MGWPVMWKAVLSGLSWLKENPKVIFGILFVVMAIWIFFVCLPDHVFDGGKSDKGNTRTVERHTDTLIVYVMPDTNLILSLYGFDTVPTSVVIDEEPKWIPTEPELADAVDCADSLSRVVATLDTTTKQLVDCDSLFRLNTARRTYNDTVENDSVRFTLQTVVDGFRVGEPKADYVWLAPQKEIYITDSIVITDSIYYGGPRRGLYIEGGVGPRMTFDNQFDAIGGSVGAGYLDKKGWRYGARVTATSGKDYTVEGVLSKEIYFGK